MVDYLYQELDGAEGEAFRAHLDGCARCAAELRSLTSMRQALRSLPEAEPSVAVTTRLLHEAGKRARSVEESSGGVLAWLAKMLTPVMAHPAWTAVGTLLLVAGVAGVLTMRGKVSERVAPVTETVAPADVAAPATPPAGVAAGAPAADPEKAGAVAPGSPPPDTAAALDRGRRDEDVKPIDGVRGGAAKPSRPDVRSPDKPEPPRDYVAKVPAPAVTASPPKPKAAAHAASAPSEPPSAGDDGYLDYKDAPAGRIGSERENEVLRAAEKKKADKSESRNKDEANTMQDLGKSSTYSTETESKPSGAKPAPAKLSPQKPQEGAPPPMQPSSPAAAAEPSVAAPSPPPPPPPAPKSAASMEEQAEGDAAALSGEAQKKVKEQAPAATTRKPAPAPQQGVLGGQAAAGPKGAGQAPANAPSAPTSTPAPAPAPEFAQQRQESAPSQTQAQNTRKQNESPEMTLLRAAQKSATSGNCADALAISQKLSKMNPEFHRKRVAGDSALRACQAESERRRQAPARAKQAAPNDELQAPDTTTTKDAAH